MSLHDFGFPEFVPLGLISRPFGGIKTEPPDVNVEENLPHRFMFGSLQKGSFSKTENGWSASYRHPTAETGADVAFNGVLKVNFSWRGEKWVATAPGRTFTDPHLCIYPDSLDEEMKDRIQQRYNLTYTLPNEKTGVHCYFPDGPPRCIVFPIRVSDLGTARKALLSMQKDGTIGAPLFAYAVMGLSIVEYNLQMAPTFVLKRLFPIVGPLSSAELPPSGEAETYKWDDGTEVLRVTSRQYFAVFHTFFCDLERVTQWLHAFPLLGDASEAIYNDEPVNIEYRGFVCEGPELTGVTMEREDKICQVTLNIRFDPRELVSLRNSDAKLDEVIEEVERKSLALRDRINSEFK